MAFAHVGSVSPNTTSPPATSIAVTRSSVTAGNLIAIWVKHEGAPTTITVSDGTTSFTGATKTNNTSNNDLSAQWFYVLSSVASGSVTYTATFGASRPYQSIFVFEASYTGTASFDTEATGQGASGANPNSADMTTTGTDEIVYGGYGEYAAVQASDGECNNINATLAFYGNTTNYTAAWGLVFTSTFTGDVDVTIGSAADWICNGIAFKTGAAGAAVIPQLITAPIRR